jgi:nucleoside 2-deoxyribosyltransferase
MKIYLCGGFGDWQDIVATEVRRLRPDADVFDPSQHKLHDPKFYTQQDLANLLDCDIVIAYMQVTNPGYANLAFELGFAYAHGKKILLVNEKGQRFAEMMHQVADNFGDLAGVLAALPLIEEFRRE